MDHKIKKFAYLVGVLIVASACNLVSNFFNPVDEVVSEIEDLAEQVDIEDIEEGLDMLATELPGGLDELGDFGDFGDLGDLSNLEATVQAFQEGFEFGEIPEDIPIVDDPKDNLFGSKDLVSYMTPMAFENVLSFYQEEMPENDWTLKDEGNIITEDTAVVQFEKPNRNAIVTLGVNPQDGSTFVMISIQVK